MEEDSLDSLGDYSICGGEGPPSPSGYPGEYSSAVESWSSSDEEEGGQPEGDEFHFVNNFIDVAVHVRHLQGPNYFFSIGLKVSLDGQRWFRLPTIETNVSWLWPGQVDDGGERGNGRRRRFQIVEVFDGDGDKENPRDPPTQPLRRSARLAATANRES